MHYYPFDVSDYRKDTGHLTMEEHYAYRVLLDECYLTEKPLPEDKRVLMRKLKLTPGQEWVLDNILLDFFVSTERGYIHPRVEVELERYREKSDKARTSANTRWHKNKKGTIEVRSNSDRNATAVRPHSEGNATGMLTKNLELRTKKEIKKGADAPGGNSSSSAPIPYQKIIDLYHGILPMLPRVVKLTDKRKSHIRARWQGDAQDLDWWREYFQVVITSKFLTGQSTPTLGRPVFRADIDFLIREDVMIKTQEGKYHRA